MESGIYGIHNIITGKWYVGQAINIRARWNMHRSLLARNEKENIHLLRAWNKYGASAFEWVVLEKCAVELLDEREIFWIAQKDSFRNGYNRTIGGGGNRGFKMSEEQKRKIGTKTAEKWADPNHRKIRLAAMRTVMDSETYRKKISDAGKRNWSNPSFKEMSLHRMHEGAMTPVARKKRSESAKIALANPDTKAKLSVASKRNWKNPKYREKLSVLRSIYINEEYRQKHSEISKRQWENEEYRNKVRKQTSAGQRARAPEVLQIETGVIFTCASDAAEKLGIKPSHISSVCCGKRVTSGGYHWRYAVETQEQWEERRKQYLAITGIKEHPHVVCIETGEVFEHITQAANKIGVDASNITKVCSGTQLTAGGYHWKYLNESNEQQQKREQLIEMSIRKVKGESSRVAVICEETGTVYDSVQIAANALSINRCGISNALRGKAKTAGGFHWKYAEEQHIHDEGLS